MTNRIKELIHCHNQIVRYYETLFDIDEEDNLGEKEIRLINKLSQWERQVKQMIENEKNK